MKRNSTPHWLCYLRDSNPGGSGGVGCCRAVTGAAGDWSSPYRYSIPKVRHYLYLYCSLEPWVGYLPNTWSGFIHSHVPYLQENFSCLRINCRISSNRKIHVTHSESEHAIHIKKKAKKGISYSRKEVRVEKNREKKNIRWKWICKLPRRKLKRTASLYNLDMALSS